ncbi:MAG: glycosyltransferase [Pseudomonadota bacterium]
MQSNENHRDDKVAIILSTYNGAKYIAAQLDSILRQTHTNWKCYIRDDGSKDETLAILASYFARDTRFAFVDAISGNMGLNSSHYYLISITTENYVAMCDQDDIWDDNKLEVTLHKLKQIETAKKIPALVHTNSVVVDSNLNIMREQFIGRRGFKKGLNGIVFANSAQGGSILINASLRQIAMQVPPVLPYDYHLAIIANLTGTRAFIPQTLLKYRQHAASSIAIADSNLPNQLNKSGYSTSLLLSLNNYRHMKQDFKNVAVTKQAESDLCDYFYLFEGKNRFKKLLIYAKNRYPFYARKDSLAFVSILFKNTDLKTLIST